MSRPTLLTADEVAEELRVNKVTVYRWAKDGILPSLRLGAGRGGAIRFRSADVDALIQNGTAPESAA